MTAASRDKPSQFPTKQVNGAPLKPITQVLLDRRATAHFKPEPVQQGTIRALLDGRFSFLSDERPTKVIHHEKDSGCMALRNGNGFGAPRAGQRRYD